MVARILTALVGIPALILLAWTGGIPFLLVVMLLSLLGLSEYYRLTRVPIGLRVWGYLAGSALLVSVFLAAGGAWDNGVALFLVALLITVLASFPRLTFEQAGSAVLGVLYVPFLFSFLLKLEGLPGGAAFTVLTFSLTWVSDTLAFLVGSRWGRHRLVPRLSPKKTWEGAVAGVAGSVLVMLGVHKWFGFASGWAAVLGLSVGLATGIGDLIESALKRLAQVKDSGHLLPGHGGILDRFDALLLAAPVMYAWLRFFR